MRTVAHGSRRPFRRVFGTALSAVVLSLAAGACSAADGTNAGGLEKVTFLTTFGQQGRDAASFVALEKGFFAEANLDVDIQPGKAGDYNHQQLAGGKAQYATVDAAGAFIRFANGKDTSFQILAAVHQLTVVGIVGLTGGSITEDPKTLEGKTLGTIKGAVPETLWPAYAKASNIDGESVEWKYAGDPAQLNQMVAAGVVDGAGLFVVGVPGVEAAAAKASKPGEKPRTAVVLPYSQRLGDLYGAVLVAQKATIDANPDQARRFAEALSRGLDYAVNHPEEAGKIMAKRAGQNPQVAAAELTLMKAYVFAGGVTTAGVLDDMRVAGMVASLTSHGLIPQGMNPEMPAKIVRFDLTPKEATTGGNP